MLIWHWFLTVTGTNNDTGRWYAFWSGFGSDIGELTIIAGLAAMYRKHNCHVRHCWRLSWKPVDGTSHVVCRKHHPESAPTAKDILEAAK